MAIAPALTIGFMGLPSFSSSAMTELNARPVLLTPTRACTRSCPTACDASANTKAFEIDWIVKRMPTSPASWMPPLTPTTLRPNHAGSASASAGM